MAQDKEADPEGGTSLGYACARQKLAASASAAADLLQRRRSVTSHTAINTVCEQPAHNSWCVVQVPEDG